MAYIRSKLVKGDKYLYLVKSIWDSKKKTSRQEIIKYLGKASDVVPEDIPEEYRNDAKIISFLANNSTTEENEKQIMQLQNKIHVGLVQGQIDKVLEIYNTYSKTSNLNNFYDHILKPTLYKIGTQWEEGKLNIADEHIASNTASELVNSINKKNNPTENKSNILICSPNGEEHNIGCSVLQSFLQKKGYRIFNLSPSAPSETIIDFIKKTKLDIVLISVTIEDNIKTAQRLIKKIQHESDIPILVGGQAVDNGKSKFSCDTVRNEPLDKTLKFIKQIIRN